MPDRRKHRGPHPEDAGLFGPHHHKALHDAVADLSWLLSRGYAMPSSLKLVGDRFQLTARQRTAVSRSSCSDDSRTRREIQRVDRDDVRGQTIEIDGFNLLTSIEAALAGGVILHGRDNCYRDMASMHGNYRKVAETIPAIEFIGATLDELGPASCRWLFDRPVSNSGRICSLIREWAAGNSQPWEVEVTNDPDVDLRASPHVIVTADAGILDAGPKWLNLARLTIDSQIATAAIVRLTE